MLNGSGNVVGVDLNYVIVALLFGFEYFKRLVGLAGSDNAVGYLALDDKRGGHVANVGECDPVTE